MFEHSLIDLETKQHPRSRRWISLPMAIGLHLVGLTAFAFASYWSVGNVVEPNLNIGPISMVSLPTPPPGGGGGGVRKPVTKPVTEDTKPVAPSEPVQPTEETIPDKIPTAATTTVSLTDLLPAGDAEGPVGDPNLPVGPGYGDGPVGPGVGDDPHGSGDGPGFGEDSQPIHITVGVTKPEPVRQVQPRYTENARRAGVQGVVILEAIIDEQGNVDNVRILRGLPMGLDREAVAAVQQWKFRPAMMASKPVKVYFTLTVNFTIQR